MARRSSSRRSARRTRRSSPRRSSKKISYIRRRKGSASAGRYRKSAGPFCGPAGGAAKGTYPVGTIKRVRNALSRAHYAPRPAGIKKCACRRAKKLGHPMPSC
jgi:hypothetical protein